jgi:hypothetical protein
VNVYIANLSVVGIEENAPSIAERNLASELSKTAAEKKGSGKKKKKN